MDNPSATSTVLCALAGGKWNVGLSKENAYSYDISVPLLSRKETHIIDRLAMLLTVFGISRDDQNLKVRYNVLSESREFAAGFLKQQYLLDRNLIGINISPGEGTRFWGVENYQALIRWLSKEYAGSPILVLYQPSDKPVAQAIAQPFPEVLLSPETKTFDQFAAFIQTLWMLITPDTSAVHLAAAFSIPSVVMYVQSNKELRVWEPYGSLSETVVTDIDDLRRISQEEVFHAVNKLVHQIGSSTNHNQHVAPPAS